jgi:hypothetical protein
MPRHTKFVVYQGQNAPRDCKEVAEAWLRERYRSVKQVEHCDERPNEDWAGLHKALSRAKKLGALLVLRRPGQAGRREKSLLMLKEFVDQGGEFVVIDNGEVLNPGNLDARIVEIRAGVAAMGRKVGETFQWRRDSGLLNGPWQPSSEEHMRMMRQVLETKARENYREYLPGMRDLQAEGKTLEAIANWANSQGCTTTRGTPMTAVTVHNLLKRTR